MGGEVPLQVTAVFQNKTTVPKEVRRLLGGVGDGDKLLWYLNDRGEVCVKKVERPRAKG